MFMTITRRILAPSALGAATTLSLGACGSSKPQTPAAAPTAEASNNPRTDTKTDAPTDSGKSDAPEGRHASRAPPLRHIHKEL